VAEKDYSGVPLWKKLGVKDGSTVAFIGKPPDVTIELPPGTDLRAQPPKGSDVIVVFDTTLARLAKAFAVAKGKLASDGGLWVAYPKKSSKISTDLTFENVQRMGLMPASWTTRAARSMGTGPGFGSSTG
jgi:hypothetical protein